MADTSLSNLHRALLAQIDRLNSATAVSVETEIERSRAMASVANVVVRNGRLVLDATKFISESADKREAKMQLTDLLGAPKAGRK